jgi:hypothetical protein
MSIDWGSSAVGQQRDPLAPPAGFGANAGARAFGAIDHAAAAAPASAARELRGHRQRAA